MDTKYASNPSAVIVKSPEMIPGVFIGSGSGSTSPKVKSAFATSAVRPNAKTNTSELVTAERAGAGIVFFILLPFQNLLVFSGRTLCAALFTAILLLKNRLFELTGSTIKKRKKESNRTILLHFSSRIW
jgi:hypothetical protein